MTFTNFTDSSSCECRDKLRVLKALMTKLSLGTDVELVNASSVFTTAAPVTFVDGGFVCSMVEVSGCKVEEV